MVPPQAVIRKAVVPATIEPARYWNTYVAYFVNVLRAGGVEVELKGHSGDELCGRGLFRVELDGRPAVMDYSDHKDCAPCTEPGLPRFKFSYSTALRRPSEGEATVFPFTPISFMDWDQYERMKAEVHYGAGDRILYMQTAHKGTDNYDRRRLVQRIIPEAFGDRADNRMLPLEDYWRAINTALVRVFAPGTRNDMLDRGQAQHFAFGCCTISPVLDVVLPYWMMPKAHVDYVRCASDYSNLVRLIDLCSEPRNRSGLQAVGRNAQALFEHTSTPPRLVRWLALCMEQYYAHHG